MQENAISISNTNNPVVLLLSKKARWSPCHHRGITTPPLIDYVLLAEFDIDTGSTLRHQFPSPIPGYKADWLAEHMLPEGAHNRMIDYTYIFIHRDGPILDDPNTSSPPSTIPSSSSSSLATPPSPSGRTGDIPFLYGINCVKTKHDSTVRRGAIVKSLCVFSQYSYIESLKQPLEKALEKYFQTPSLTVLEDLFHRLNETPMRDLPKPSMLELLLMRRGVVYDPLSPGPVDHQPQAWSLSIAYPGDGDNREHLLTIPIYRTLDEVGNISLSNLVHVFGENVMRIYHAVLLKQRVLFVGYNHATEDIAQIVLSAVAMVSPPMSGVIKRTFPYATLSDLGFTEVKGYIAGVTNPMFQQHDQWWDLLCVLDLPNSTAQVISADDRRAEDTSSSSSSIKHASMGSASTSSSSTRNNTIPSSGSNGQPSGTSKLNLVNHEDTPHYHLDMKFLAKVQSGIANNLPEDWVQQQFHDYTSAILNFAQDKGTLLNSSRLHEKAKKFYDGNLQRFEALKNCSILNDIPLHPWVWAKEDSVSEDVINEEGKEKVPPSPTPSSPKRPPRFERGLSTSSNTSNPSDHYYNAHNSHGNADFILLKSYVRKLQLESPENLNQPNNNQNINNTKVAETAFQHLERHLRSEKAIQGLLVLMPESQEGLLPLAAGLFHANPLIKLCTTVLLKRIQSFDSTRPAFQALNLMVQRAYERQKLRLENGSLEQEVDAMLSHRKSLNQQDINDIFLSTSAASGSSALTSLTSNVATAIGSYINSIMENEGEGDKEGEPIVFNDV
eukprot:gene4229-4646_t